MVGGSSAVVLRMACERQSAGKWVWIVRTNMFCVLTPLPERHTGRCNATQVLLTPRVNSHSSAHSSPFISPAVLISRLFGLNSFTSSHIYSPRVFLRLPAFGSTSFANVNYMSLKSKHSVLLIQFENSTATMRMRWQIEFLQQHNFLQRFNADQNHAHELYKVGSKQRMQSVDDKLFSKLCTCIRGSCQA